MSITLGVYELFAYTIPGILYLYIANEFLGLLGFKHLEFKDLDNIGINILLLIVSYVFGQGLNFLAAKWRRLFQQKEATIEAIEKLKKNHPYLKIKFAPSDWPVLQSIIRQYHPETVTNNERNKAISIMMQNISLSFLIYTFYQSIQFFLNGFSVENLAFAITSFIATFLSRNRSRIYNQWFYDHIYEAALSYNPNTIEIIKIVQGGKASATIFSRKK